MVICIIALIVFSVLSIFSARYRPIARDAFKCVFLMIQLKPCDVGLEDKIKTRLTSKLMKAPRLARFFYKNFKVLSWLFTLTFFASLIYSGYSIFNLLVYGSCDPNSSVCVLTPIGICIIELQNIIAFAILIILFIALVYSFVKKRNGSL